MKDIVYDESSYKKIVSFLTNYDLISLAKAIFIINAWPQNLSSQCKSLLLNKILVKTHINSFKGEFKISSYDDFLEFTNRLIEILPEFYQYEYYQPIMDYGEIKFYFEGEFYNVFYGGGYEATYDYYSLFEIQYIPFDDTFKQNQIVSPKDCFIELLTFVHNFIKMTKSEFNVGNIKIGNFEVPNREFWGKCNKFIDYIDNNKENYSSLFEVCTFNNSRENDNVEYISIDDIFSEEWIFLKNESSIMPIFSRNFIVILLDRYSHYANTLESGIDKEIIINNICNYLIKYILERFTKKEALFGVQSFNLGNKQFGNVFYCISFITERNVFLFKFIENIDDIDSSVASSLT